MEFSKIFRDGLIHFEDSRKLSLWFVLWEFKSNYDFISKVNSFQLSQLKQRLIDPLIKFKKNSWLFIVIKVTQNLKWFIFNTLRCIYV